MKAKAIFLASVLLASCQSSKQDNASAAEQHKSETSTDHGQAQKLMIDDLAGLAWLPDEQASSTQSELWRSIRRGMQLEIPRNDRVHEQKENYLKRKNSLQDIAIRSEPYMHFIVEQLKQRNMPMELALLPMVESAFNPHATSHASAAGLWQIMPQTGRNYGLKNNQWYDGRRDVADSTSAALDMLQYLNRMFDGDWLLTMAAYNCGEGRVLQAIKRNKSEGKQTDYWSLALPKETMLYVPKILALSDVIRHNQRYGLQLPETDETRALAQFDIGQQIMLKQAAQMAGLPLAQMKAYNPGYKRGVTAPNGPHYIMVPRQNLAQLQDSLSSEKIVVPASALVIKNDSKSANGSYKVRSGDTLTSIAKRLDVKTKDLKRWNGLKDNSVLKVGQTLQVANKSSITYKVRKGDSLYSIARRHGVNVNDVKRWNSELSKKGNQLQPGIKLTLYVNHSNASGS
ncbi:murein transglycosylase D [Serratia microhaemolytica]|uniref:murein transglycosylase D n=1 Tax=Serratia microhaemolytica TaxID=2675110 RepID=UPI000FDE3CD1|nr:murein transglycosylase D [Serratia microhaemolytica]